MRGIGKWVREMRVCGEVYGGGQNSSEGTSDGGQYNESTGQIW